MKKRQLPLPCLVLVSALVLVACGGGGGGSDESQIEEAIETSATTADPANCTKLETANFVEQSSGEEGAAALKTCEKEAKEPEGKAESVAVSEVEVEGSKATAVAAITGGSLESQTVSVALVEEDGQWKLDELTGFVKFDPKALAKVFKEQLEKTGEASAAETRCIVSGIEAAPEAELEEIIIDDNSAPIVELAEGCSSE